MRWKGTSPSNHCWYQIIRVFFLPHTKDRSILSSFIWIGYQLVTDGRTELLWLIQRSALQAMWPRCKNGCQSTRHTVNSSPVNSSSGRLFRRSTRHKQVVISSQAKASKHQSRTAAAVITRSPWSPPLLKKLAKKVSRQRSERQCKKN